MKTSLPGAQSAPSASKPKADPDATLRELYRSIWAARETPGMDLAKLQETLQHEADSLWRADYLATVAGIVDEMLSEAKEHPKADLSDYIHEQADGNAFVIYNGEAAQVLRLSDNADAWEEESSLYENVNQRAYAALEADIRDEMRHRDLSPYAETLGDLLAPKED